MNSFLSIFAMAPMLLAINADSWKDTLPVMGIGMVGIFLVLGFIVLITYGLNKIFSAKKKDNNGDKKDNK